MTIKSLSILDFIRVWSIYKKRLNALCTVKKVMFAQVCVIPTPSVTLTWTLRRHDVDRLFDLCYLSYGTPEDAAK